MKLLLLLISLGVFFFISKMLVNQAKQFLLEHAGPSLTNFQIYSVKAVFIFISSVLTIEAVSGSSSYWGAGKIIGLLAWGIPMVLLDMRNYWLPLRFTTGFWVSGLLFSLLPENSITFTEAAVGSGVMFAVLYAFYLLSKFFRNGEEGFGLGDVHLIAGLCAWLPWSQASLLSGYAFLFLFFVILIKKDRYQPYAPWLFALLSCIAVYSPKLLISGVV